MNQSDDADKQPTILGISGSLRASSYNTALLRLAARVTGSTATMHPWQDLVEVPPFNEDQEPTPPPPVQRMRATITNADAVLIATPEYNTTLPGQLKTMLDWASRPTHHGVFADKPTAIIGASLTPYGAKWAQHTLRSVLAACGAHLVGDPLTIPHADTAFTSHGTLREPAAQEQLQQLVSDLTQATHRPEFA